jgi:hypothetical protein
MDRKKKEEGHRCSAIENAPIVLAVAIIDAGTNYN